MKTINDDMEMKSSTKTQSSCSLWIELLHQQMESQEEIRKLVLLQVDAALDSLAGSYSWDEAYIFGSLIKEGKFSNRSDVDIAVKGLNKFEYFSFIGDISAFLGRGVDVIRLEDCHFRNSIISGGIKWSSKKSSPSS